jgi:hypothetical protein
MYIRFQTYCSHAIFSEKHRHNEKEIAKLVETFEGKTKKMLLLLEKWDAARIKIQASVKGLETFSDWASQIENDLHKVDRMITKMSIRDE